MTTYPSCSSRANGITQVTLAASVTDIRERRIPNELILIGLVIAAAVAATSGRWLDALAGGVLGVAILTLPRLVARDAVGLGDVKLVGVGVGVTGVVVVVGVAVLTAAAVLGLMGLPSGGQRGRSLPLAPFVAVGTLGYVAVTLTAGAGAGAG